MARLFADFFRAPEETKRFLHPIICRQWKFGLFRRLFASHSPPASAPTVPMRFRSLDVAHVRFLLHKRGCPVVIFSLNAYRHLYHRAPAETKLVALQGAMNVL